MTQVAPMPYPGVLGMFDASVVNGRHYALAIRWLPALTDDTAAMLTAAAADATSPFSAIAVHHFHGAAARVPAQDTAFTLRRDHLLVEILAAWEPSTDDDGAAHRAWAQDLPTGPGRRTCPGNSPPARCPAATPTCSDPPTPTGPCSPTGPMPPGSATLSGATTRTACSAPQPGPCPAAPGG
jgi:hypothetical protein